MRICPLLVLLTAMLGCAGARDAQCPITALPVAPAPPASSCAKTTPSAQPPAEPAAPAIPTLSWIAAAKTIRIERGRGGLGAGWVVHYDLRRKDSSFQGTAVVSANRQARATGGRESKRQFRSGALELNISASDVQGFLDSLSRVAIRGPVAPGTVQVEASDDYPWWIIDIEEADDCTANRCVPARALRLSNPPTGSRPAPWFLWSSDRPTEVDPIAPAAACEGLVPHLRDDALQALIR